MAFKIHNTSNSGVQPIEYLGATAADYTVGQPLVYVSGYLKTCSSGVGEDTDEGKHYVSMEEVTIATNGDLLGVIPAKEGIIWEAPNYTGSQTMVPGTAYTLHTDGLSVTGTTTKGCFTVLSTDGTDAGDMNLGYLV